MQNLSTSRRISPPLFPCRVASGCIRRRFIPVDASGRRIAHSGEGGAREVGMRGWFARVRFLSLSLSLRHFQAGSPNTDRRLFQSALATPGWCSQPPSCSPVQLRAAARLLFSGDTSTRNLLGRREKSWATGFPYVEERGGVSRYVSEAKFIEIRAYACSARAERLSETSSASSARTSWTRADLLEKALLSP